MVLIRRCLVAPPVCPRVCPRICPCNRFSLSYSHLYSCVIQCEESTCMDGSTAASRRIAFHSRRRSTQSLTEGAFAGCRDFLVPPASTHIFYLCCYCCCFCFWSRVISRANQAAHPLHAPLMSIRLCKYLLGASYSSSISPTAPRFPLLLLNSSYSFSVFATVPQCLTFPPLFSNCSSTLLVHINSSPTHQMNSHWFLHLLNASAFFPVPPIPLSTLPLSFATSIPLITLQYLSFLFNFYNKIHHSKKSCFPDTQQVDRKLTCSRKTIF